MSRREGSKAAAGTEGARLVARTVRDKAAWLYTYRDGRDALVSYHCLTGGRASISEFLRQTVRGENRVRAWARHVERWLREPRVTHLRMKDVLSSPDRAIARLEAATGLQARWTEPRLPRRTRSVWSGRLDRLLRVRPESTAILPKRGEPVAAGGWRRLFTRADREFFREHAGHLLIRLGYERSDEWVDGRGSAEQGPIELGEIPRQDTAIRSGRVAAVAANAVAS